MFPLTELSLQGSKQSAFGFFFVCKYLVIECSKRSNLHLSGSNRNDWWVDILFFSQFLKVFFICICDNLIESRHFFFFFKMHQRIVHVTWIMLSGTKTDLILWKVVIALYLSLYIWPSPVRPAPIYNEFSVELYQMPIGTFAIGFLYGRFFLFSFGAIFLSCCVYSPWERSHMLFFPYPIYIVLWRAYRSIADDEANVSVNRKIVVKSCLMSAVIRANNNNLTMI